MSKKRVMAILFSSLLMGVTITAGTYISNNNIGVESEIKCEEKDSQDEKEQSFKEFENKNLRHSIQKRKIIKDTNPDVDVCAPRSTNQNSKKK